ncbi:ABC transporter permease [Subtercola boreus]|uniref:Transport permease protein n=1 Tax=Subtercola boreus TaxID=120213 RepID=A0A3E0WE63_9MICO|nr:ABC transporter permease [Subtercola boreus]RFA22650.1 sugar ABC transporter [Subtercola boreus]RFA23006.1 sugar ABC transporter [Subtercola boreus]RFA28757.1 sugar ABC transporter [Subtercola boreus]
MATQAEVRAARLAELPFEASASAGPRSVGGFVTSVREIFSHRELLDLLIRRELKSRYKDSALGFLWSLIKPLVQLIIYYVFIGQVLGAARNVADFAIFVFAGLTLWGLYSETISTGTASIVSNGGLIKKVYLPREIFPLAATGSAIFNFLVQMLVLIAAILVLGQFPVSLNLLYVPASIAVVLIWGVAFAVLLSALNVYLRDIQYLVEVVMLLLFWASPIVYSWSFVVTAVKQHTWLLDVYLLNPISLAMLAFQRGLWQAGNQTRVIDGKTIPPQDWPASMELRLVVAAVVGLVVMFIAQRIFARLQGNFAQEI